MNKIKRTLEKLWLNEKEIRIYLTSLALWQSPASLLWQRNNIARSTAQYTCQSLADKWLMNVIPKWNTFLYSPANPERLLTLVNKEYDKVEKKFHETRQIMGDLKSMMNPLAKLPKVRYFTWVDGIIDMFEDVLKVWKDVYGYLYFWDDMNKEVLDYLQNIYIENRLKSWFYTYTILNDHNKYEFFIKNARKLKRAYKYISSDLYPFDVCIQIYGNKVAYYSYKDTDLTWVIIENDHVANTQLSAFKALWDWIKDQET